MRLLKYVSACEPEGQEGLEPNRRGPPLELVIADVAEKQNFSVTFCITMKRNFR